MTEVVGAGHALPLRGWGGIPRQMLHLVAGALEPFRSRDTDCRHVRPLELQLRRTGCQPVLRAILREPGNSIFWRSSKIGERPARGLIPALCPSGTSTVCGAARPAVPHSLQQPFFHTVMWKMLDFCQQLWYDDYVGPQQLWTQPVLCSLGGDQKLGAYSRQPGVLTALMELLR